MAFKERTSASGNVFKWETPGTVLQGRLIGFKQGKKFANNPEPSKLIIIQQDDGVQRTVGAPTALYGKLVEPPAVQPGSYIRITYLGLANGKGGTQYKNFKLEVDEAPVAPAPQAPVSGASDQPVDEYDRLAARLRLHNPAHADKQLKALAELYPDPAERLSALAETLKQQGVAA